MSRLFSPDTGQDPADPSPGGPDPDGPAGEAAGRLRWSDHPGRWRRGWVIAALALALALVLALHSRIPNQIGSLGSLVQTFLPWLGLGVPVLAVCGIVRRSVTALAAVLVPALVWLELFGGLLADKRSEGGALEVVSHNVDASNPDPRATARALAASGADLIALQELPPERVSLYEEALAARYPYHSVRGTVGLWSRYPIENSAPVDTGMGWTRAMRATVRVGGELGEVAVYVAHLPSVRVALDAGFTAGRRDEAAEMLAQTIAAEPLGQVLLLGDLNGTVNDGALAPLTSQLRSAQGAAGAGFGFSWPASFPLARIDQILVGGLEPVSAWTLPRTGSDHLPVAATVDPGDG
ncbi:endonuclease/exonuclease/phosphatase family protein [Streptomyces sp. 7-21]|jgi:vancomycin resistance protein VanJ|uniref:endonuclease/exonuclease/phosphatase family protein n=1 Tax=Streptomyces sp. 7-21 TaxID=2802283 RepID=UPI0019201693|nr:endonuclease/exonuclease/phosphatase family protein [Streptomyces sp. 7-21]MBL1066658.1 endonuclease/exonuclease/phosphatase family protein [Streptomyces sp. 7-21]